MNQVSYDTKGNITLYDILHIASILNENDIDFRFIKNAAKRSNWLNQFLYFLDLTNQIYHNLYGNYILRNSMHVNPKLNSYRALHLPFRIPFCTAVSLRIKKLLLDLRYWGVISAANDLWAYSTDMIRIIFEMFSIPTIPFLNILRFIKKGYLKIEQNSRK